MAVTNVTLPIRIAGIGAHLPATVVDNHAWSRVLDTSDEWIRTRTGIRERRRVGAEQATSDLAVVAGKAALADAGLGVDDVGTVMVTTTTPDHTVPGTAPLVAAGLGTEAPAFDLNAACSGFVYGLRTAGALAATGAGAVLLIGAETLTRITDPSDREVAVLFGDGAGAAVLVHDVDGELGPFDAGSDGHLADILSTPAGGTRRPSTVERVADGEHWLSMRGPEVYRHAVTRMVASSRAVLDAARLQVADVDLLVGHQANRRILEAVSGRLGVPPDRCHVTVDRHGNTSAASIPLALADARDTGRLHPGDRILLTAFGAGLTWASTLLRWPGPRSAG